MIMKLHNNQSMNCENCEKEKDAVWRVSWWAQGIQGRYLGNWKRDVCDSCIEDWLEKIRPANDIHYARVTS